MNITALTLQIRGDAEHSKGHTKEACRLYADAALVLRKLGNKDAARCLDERIDELKKEAANRE